MATAALSEGIITPDYTVYCPGQHHDLRPHVPLRQDGRATDRSTCATRIEQSCDVYFYKLGSMMKIDTIHEYAEKLGLVGKTGIDLPGEVDSLVPSTEWKLRRPASRWYPGETISVGIGQGAGVGHAHRAGDDDRDGRQRRHRRHAARRARRVDDGDGWEPVPAPAPRSVVPLPPDVLRAVRDGLWLAVNGAGTAGSARIAGRDVVGKTGTAQVVSLENAAGRRPDVGRPARQQLVRVLRAARPSADCRRRLRRARRHGAPRPPRRSRATCSRRISPSRTAGRCRVLRRPACADDGARDEPAPAPPAPADRPRRRLADPGRGG